MNRVSIIMPVFNGAKYITHAIESVLNQTYKNIELIIVDDGSTDNSFSIAKSFEGGIVKVFSQEHSGACRARNLAFELSTGDFIQYLDADDIIACNKIEEQMKLFEKHGRNCIIFCSYTRNYNEFLSGNWHNLEIDRNWTKPIDLFVDIYNGKGNIMGISWLFPREKIKNSEPWNENLIKAQDWDFVTRIALRSNAIYYCENTVVYARLTGQNITSNSSFESLQSVLEAAESVKNIMLLQENSERVKKSMVSLYSRIYSTYLNYNNSKDLASIERIILGLGGELEFVGNKYFGYLAKFIGVRNSMLMKYTLKKVFH